MTDQCEHVWFYPDFDNSAYAHCMMCPATLMPKDIVTMLNEHARLKRKIGLQVRIIRRGLDRQALLRAEIERLREAINRALDLDSRSSTEAGWKRDIVKAIKGLREALFEGVE